MKKFVALAILILLLSSSSFAQSQFGRLNEGDYVQLNDCAVQLASFSSGDDGYDFFFGKGIKVLSQGYAYEGDVVQIEGNIITLPDGSRAIVISGGQTIDYGYPLYRTIGIPLKHLSDAMVPKQRRVRVWGSVTSTNTSASPISNSYVLDGITTIFDNVSDYSTTHIVGTFESDTGMCSVQLDSTGNLVPVIFQCYPGSDTNEPRDAPTWNVTGHIYVDPNAAGQTAIVWTDSCNTTCILDSSGTGEYQMTLPSGNYVISAEVPTYSTCAMIGRINQDYTNADFYWFEPMPVDYVANLETRANTGSIGAINVWKHDAEARSVPNSQFSWVSDNGQQGIVTTDSGGMAQILVSSTTSKVVSVDIGDEETSYVQFATPIQPTLFITAPVNGDIEHDWMNVDIDFEESPTGRTFNRWLYIDNKPYGRFNVDTDAKLNTLPLFNGLHQLVAIASDSAGNQTRSNTVWFTTQNDFSSVSFPNKNFTIGDKLTFSTKLNMSNAWAIDVVNCITGAYPISANGNKRTMGAGGLASLVWDTTGSSPGVYKISLYGDAGFSSQQSQVDSNGNAVALSTDFFFTLNDTRRDGTLILGCLSNEDQDLQLNTVNEICDVWQANITAGVHSTVLIDPLWKLDSDRPTEQCMKYWLEQSYTNIFMSTHGAYFLDPENNKMEEHISFADEDVTYLPVVTPRDRQFEGIIFHAFTDYNTNLRTTWNIIHINACWSAGSWLDLSNLDYIQKEYSQAFNLTLDNPNGGCFIGWLSVYQPGMVLHIPGLSRNGEGWTRAFWYYLGVGYSVADAESFTQFNLDPTTWGTQGLFVDIFCTYNSWVTWLKGAD